MDLSFFLVKVEAVRIGTSPAAPLFTVLSSPDKQVKEFGEEKKEWADREIKQAEFWKGLLEKSKKRTKLFTTISPSKAYWIGTGAGRGGCAFNHVILMDSGAVELYIDLGKDSGEQNKKIFDALQKQQAEIEREFGGTLEWQRLDDKRACRIRKRFTDGGFSRPETWDQLQDEMIDAMDRLNNALRRRIAEIEV